MEKSKGKYKVLHKITNPHPISLYLNTGGSTNIFFYFTINGSVKRGSTKTTDLNTAINTAIGVFYEFSKGKRKTIKKTKLKTIINLFLKQKEGENLSANTIRDYKRQSNKLIEFFGNKPVDEFGDKQDYKNYTQWRLNYYKNNPDKIQPTYYKNGKKVTQRHFNNVGNHTINRELRLLVNILRFAKTDLKLLQDKEIPPYQILPENRREEIIKKKEYEKLKSYWMKKYPYYWLIIDFCYNTGIRYPSELNNIKWEDINWRMGYVTIKNRKNKNKNTIINTPIPIQGRIYEILYELRERNKKLGIPFFGNNPVFTDENGIQIQNINKAFKKSLIEIGIVKKLSMYSLRHTFTTNMSHNPDMPIKTLADILGHTSTTMIDKNYSHSDIRQVKQIFKNIEMKKNENKPENDEIDKLKKEIETLQQENKLLKNKKGKELKQQKQVVETFFGKNANKKMPWYDYQGISIYQ